VLAQQQLMPLGRNGAISKTALLNESKAILSARRTRGPGEAPNELVAQ
jgi:hypothetical protein